jgi:hypothetical protein
VNLGLPFLATFVYRASALGSSRSPAHAVKEGAASLQAHAHLTSREAGFEIWIYEDLWNLGKEK